MFGYFWNVQTQQTFSQTHKLLFHLLQPTLIPPLSYYWCFISVRRRYARSLPGGQREQCGSGRVRFQPADLSGLSALHARTHARHASHVSEPRRVSTRICAAESPPLRETSLRNQSENRSDRQSHARIEARAIGVGNVVDPIRRNGKPCHDSLGPPPATRGAVQPCAEYKGGKRRREVRFKEGGHQQVQHCGTWIFVPM